MWARISAWSVPKKVLAAIGLLAALVVFHVAYSGVRAWVAWRGIDRFSFDVDAARASLDVPAPDALDGGPYVAYLIVGIDERPPGDPTAQANVYADSILLWLEPPGGGPMLVSIPRDLYVTNPCDGSGVKLDATFQGCGDTANGPEVVTLAVEEFTGVTVDHFALVRFEGLVRAIDSLGGITLCSPYALRHGENDILPAGCSTVDGVHALDYSRARNAEALVDGVWTFEDGADALRTRRQQEVLLAMLSKARALRTPGRIATTVTAIGRGVELDDTLSLRAAVGLALHLRSIPLADIRTVSIPTESFVTPDGRFGVVATETFAEVLAGV